MVPYYPFDLLEDCQQAIKVIYEVVMPCFVGFDSNGDLYVAIQASPEVIVTAMVAPLPSAPHIKELVGS